MRGPFANTVGRVRHIRHDHADRRLENIVATAAATSGIVIGTGATVFFSTGRGRPDVRPTVHVLLRNDNGTADGCPDIQHRRSDGRRLWRRWRGRWRWRHRTHRQPAPGPGQPSRLLSVAGPVANARRRTSVPPTAATATGGTRRTAVRHRTTDSSAVASSGRGKNRRKQREACFLYRFPTLRFLRFYPLLIPL